MGIPMHICRSCDSPLEETPPPCSSTIRFLHLQPKWHQTDLRSAFHLYQSCPVIAFHLHMDTNSLCALLTCFVLIILPLFFTCKEGTLTVCFCPCFAHLISPIWILGARDPCWATYPGAKACWLGVLLPLDVSARAFTGQYSTRCSVLFLGEVFE